MSAIALPALKTEAAATPQRQLAALLEGAGVVALGDTGWMRVAGEDRVRWLNGMTTNSIQQLAPGEGCYNFFLSAQGRIQGDAYAFAETDAVLLQTDRPRLPALMALLERFIIMDDVELTDLSPDRFGLLCAGPETAKRLAEMGIDTADLVSPPGLKSADWNGETLTVLRAYSPLVPRFEVWTGSEEAAGRLAQALQDAGAVGCDAEALDHLRMLEGTPLYGKDIRDRELPQETAQTRALHFAKGCYLGQEIVERIRSRGNVHRTLQQFELTGELPVEGTVLEAEGKAVGELISVAALPLKAGNVQLGLGYIRREALDKALPITYSGGFATPSTAPYRG